MHLCDIEKGAAVKLVLIEDGSEIEAVFVRNFTNKSLSVHNADLYDNFDKFRGKQVTVLINYRGDPYKSLCTIVEKDTMRGNFSPVILDIISDFKLEQLRASIRITHRVQIAIYEYEENQPHSYKGNFICESFSADISKDGVKLIAKCDLNKPRGAMFVLEFSLFPGYTFTLPARLMRSCIDSINSFDYGFCFDFTSSPGQRDRLILDMFKAKLL